MGVFYEESSIWLFLLVSVVLGGAAAWKTGRALASVWKSEWWVVPAALALGAGVRFLHFALFEGTLLSAHFWLVDSAVCALAGWLGWRFERAGAMARQYAFAFARVTPFRFERKA